MDTNLLIALFDPAHIHHESAHHWFKAVGMQSWSTCPVTENGFVRIVSSPAYPNVDLIPEEASQHLKDFKTQHSSYRFWAADLSLTEEKFFEWKLIRGHRQITDIYLVGLCKKHRGKLATFDRSIPFQAVTYATIDLLEHVPALSM